MAERIQVYTDGGASPNPGPGGWGAVLLLPGAEPREMCGGDDHTTNNRMELQGAIEALSALPESSVVELHTDSTYVRNGITKWLGGWKKRGWKTASGGDVQNAELWRELEAVEKGHDVTWRWVKGHAGNRWNEVADQLATRGRHLQVRGGGGAPPRASASARGGEAQPSAAPKAEAAAAVEIPAGAIRIGLAVAMMGKGPRARAGWAATLDGPGGKDSCAGVMPGAAPNRAYLVALLEALDRADEKAPIVVVTGHAYVRDGLGSWLPGWIQRDFRQKSGGMVQHDDLWRLLAERKERFDLRVLPASTDAACGELADNAKELAKASLGGG